MDTAAMKRSFERAGALGDEVPLYFYSHLFLTHPETREMFPVSMMQQRDRLLAALGHVVAKVDDLDELVPFLQQLGRDHRKFGALAEHYPAVGASLLATLQHFLGDEWTPELAADWEAAYGLVAQVMVEAADGAGQEPPWWDAKVVGHERRTPDIAVLQVRPAAPLRYEAGQSISIETQLRPRLWRYLSIASAPDEEGVLELHVQARDGGPVSTALAHHLAVGDIVRLGPPFGQLALDPSSERDLLLVAGGTGLAPMKALIGQVARQEHPRRVHLFWGARRWDDLYDLDAVQGLAAEHSWLTLTVALSDEQDYPGEQGEIADVVVRHGPWTSWDVHVCGSPGMVRATRGGLISHRVPASQIRTEAYTPSRQAPSVERGGLR